MATHSNIVDWRIQWTEEPGGLQSMESQRAGHHWSDLAHSITQSRDNEIENRKNNRTTKIKQKKLHFFNQQKKTNP